MGRTTWAYRGPSEAFTVLLMKKSTSLKPRLALMSQPIPFSKAPRIPSTIELSVDSPPKLGVKPPGKSSWKEKQFGSLKTWFRGGWVRDIVGDVDGGAVAGAVGITDEEGVPSIAAERRLHGCWDYGRRSHQ